MTVEVVSELVASGDFGESEEALKRNAEIRLCLLPRTWPAGFVVLPSGEMAKITVSENGEFIATLKRTGHSLRLNPWTLRPIARLGRMGEGEPMAVPERFPKVLTGGHGARPGVMPSKLSGVRV